MNAKLILYLFSSAIVIFSIDSVNINQIFKKNRVLQATLFYLVCTICISYLVVNFLYDFYTYTRLGGVV